MSDSPPQNLEAEESVLGAMMVSLVAVDAVFGDVRLGAEDFYRPRHQLIFAAIEAMYRSPDAAIDSLTVAAELGRRGVLEDAGGADLIAQLASSTPTPGNAAHYAGLVSEAARLRRALDRLAPFVSRIRAGEIQPGELGEELDSALAALALEEHRGAVPIVGPMDARIERAERIAAGEREPRGLPTGLPSFDRALGNLQPGRLIVIGGRPGSGKSSLAINIAGHVAMQEQKPVLFISAEMDNEEIAERLIVDEAKINNVDFGRGTLPEKGWASVMSAAGVIEKAPLLVRDTPPNMAEIRADARRVATQHRTAGGLGLIVVDYLQLIGASREARQQGRVAEVSEVARGLKLLARELRVPVLACSQLRRESENRADGKPRLADLRESGEIEQAADQVALLWADPDQARRFELDIAKNRHGPLGNIELLFLAARWRFREAMEEASSA